MKLSDGFINSICEIKSDINELICIGTIDKLAEDIVEMVGYRTDDLTMMAVGRQVKISARTSKEFCVVEGIVHSSTRNRLIVKDIKGINNSERRSFFRVPTANLSAKLYKKSDKDTKINISIKNISLSGLLFKVLDEDFNIQENEKFSVDIVLSGMSLSLDLLVTRIIPENEACSGLSYGCILPSMNEIQKDTLCNYIFTKEREIIKSSRNI